MPKQPKPPNSSGSSPQSDGDTMRHKAVSHKAVAALGLAQADRSAIALCGGWALLSGLLFVGFGAAPAAVRTAWFPIVVSLLKVGAFLLAALLCWRNTRDDGILSGQRVWQAIAAGMVFYALGDITVILWRSLWGLTGRVPLGDAFYAASYLLLVIGLLSALLPRQIMLTAKQSLGIGTIGIVSIVLACWMNFYMPTSPSVAGSLGEPRAIAAAPAGDEPVQAISADAKGAAIGSIAGSGRSAPALLQTINQRLSPISRVVGLLYVAGDCALVIMATAMLITFWGGSYSEAWKLIALAGLCLYVADMFLVYHVGKGSYEQGAAWELFWILSALFFGLGAGVERGVSAAMRQQRGRQRWL